jgi:hypothetical protein
MAYKKKKSSERKTNLYPEELKRKVVDEYLLGHSTKLSILKKYNIRGSSSIQKWMVDLGYINIRRPSLPIFEEIKSIKLSDNKKLTPADRLLLEQEIKQLKRKLEDEQLRSLMYAKLIEKAEKEYKIPIVNKPNTK